MRPDETSLGGRGQTFPSTSWSVLREAKDPRSPQFREAADRLCRMYWKPVYAYFRSARSLSNEEAKDITQEFFLDFTEGTLLERYSSERGSFRSFLRGALHYFLLNYREKAAAQKRGGDRKVLSLDVEAGLPEPVAGMEPGEVFDRQWAHSVLDHALEELRRELAGSRDLYLRIFERYDLAPAGEDPPTYARLAEELEVKETDVTNALFHCRRRLKKLVEDRILEYVGDAGELPAEMARIFSALAQKRS